MPRKKKPTDALTVMEVAGRLGVAVYDVFQLINSGALVAQRLGDHWRVTEENLKSYMDRRRH